jgi:hypothetical protein
VKVVVGSNRHHCIELAVQAGIGLRPSDLYVCKNYDEHETGQKLRGLRIREEDVIGDVDWLKSRWPRMFESFWR